MRRIRLLIALVGGLALLLLCAACSGTPAAEDELQTVVNPVHECTAEELTAQTGITLNAPITAVDVSYRYIDGEKEPLAQVTFTYQGKVYTYRAQRTETIEDISGMYYDWTTTTNDSEDTPYTCYFTDGGQGIALWYADGTSYALCMMENASEEALVTMYGIVTA